MLVTKIVKADNSILLKTGHFYFALTKIGKLLAFHGKFLILFVKRDGEMAEWLKALAC